MEDANKIKEVFEYLDDDNDGYISYKNMIELLNKNEFTNYETENEWIKDALHNGDNVTLSTESWYYMSDVLYPLEQYLEDNPSEVESEKDHQKRSLKKSHLNPLYRKKGWNLQQLTDAYIKYQFFDLDQHYSLLSNIKNNNKIEEKTEDKNGKRVYNLLCDLAINAPSISLIIKHGLATGQFLYVHILNADEDPDKMTWEKLEELHEQMGTQDILRQTRESEEILPQDVLFYDPDQCTSPIPTTIPDYSVFWHSVFENQLQDLPDFVVQDYFDTVVKPDIEKNNDGMFIEPKNIIERDKMIEEHVYNEMEQHMQSWLWAKYAQYLTDPAFSVTTWGEHNLMMNLKT